MITCLVIATPSSQAFTDATGRAVDEVLTTAIGEERETGVELVDRPEMASASYVMTWRLRGLASDYNENIPVVAIHIRT